MKDVGISKFSKSVLIALFLLVAYMLYVLTSTIYKNYQIDRNITQFEDENKKLAMKNAELSEAFEYYTSEAYQEKIAKQNFGLMKPGEEVIILPESDVKTFAEEEDVRTKNMKRWNALSNPKKWFLFFFEQGRY